MYLTSAAFGRAAGPDRLPSGTLNGGLVMRKTLIALTGAVLLASASAALAQSHQGGYLGLNPGSQQATAPSVPPPPVVGSHQGGYLGINPGAHQEPAAPPHGDMMASPTAWCDQGSPHPSYCYGRAANEDKICQSAGREHYASCRFALDQMYSR
jgi:hypothetical protein